MKKERAKARPYLYSITPNFRCQEEIVQKHEFLFFKQNFIVNFLQLAYCNGEKNLLYYR